MIYIYQADSKAFRQKKELKELLRELPPSMHEQAQRYRFAQDAFNFVLGRLLLKKGLEELGLGNQLEQLTFQENGKPVLEGVFFNISHSKDLVVCALSLKGAIGIDVENVKPLNLNHFKSWFTSKEWDNINNAPVPIQRFHWYWTRKESIIKALGVKLSYLHQIELDATAAYFTAKGKKWYLRDLDFGTDYLGALCTEEVVVEVVMRQF